MNFNGAIGESHLKNKTKQPAWRTKMCVKDMEYQTAVKDYEQIVLQHGYDKVLNIWKEVIMENVDNMVVRLGRRYFVFWKDDILKIKEIMHEKKMTDDAFLDWKGFLDNETFMEYLEENHLENILLHAEVNVWGCKIMENPVSLNIIGSK